MCEDRGIYYHLSIWCEKAFLSPGEEALIKSPGGGIKTLESQVELKPRIVLRKRAAVKSKE